MFIAKDDLYLVVGETVLQMEKCVDFLSPQGFDPSPNCNLLTSHTLLQDLANGGRPSRHCTGIFFPLSMTFCVLSNN